MDIEAISVEELNKYIKDKLDNDEYLKERYQIVNCIILVIYILL